MIRIFIRQNSIHSFTWRAFLPDSQEFQMWRFGFASIHSTEAFYRYDFSWFFSGFPSWRLALSALHKVHRSCECLKNKTFTPGTYEFQQETRSVWRGEYFFREIINVYTRARTAYSLSSLLLFSAWLIRFACTAGYYVQSSSQLADHSAGLLDKAKQLPDLYEQLLD